MNRETETLAANFDFIAEVIRNSLKSSPASVQPTRLDGPDESTAHRCSGRIEPRNSSVRPVSGVSCAAQGLSLGAISANTDSQQDRSNAGSEFKPEAAFKAHLEAHDDFLDSMCGVDG